MNCPRCGIPDCIGVHRPDSDFCLKRQVTALRARNEVLEAALIDIKEISEGTIDGVNPDEFTQGQAVFATEMARIATEALERK